MRVHPVNAPAQSIAFSAIMLSMSTAYQKRKNFLWQRASLLIAVAQVFTDWAVHLRKIYFAKSVNN